MQISLKSAQKCLSYCNFYVVNCSPRIYIEEWLPGYMAAQLRHSIATVAKGHIFLIISVSRQSLDPIFGCLTCCLL